MPVEVTPIRNIVTSSILPHRSQVIAVKLDTGADDGGSGRTHRLVCDSGGLRHLGRPPLLGVARLRAVDVHAPVRAAARGAGCHLTLTFMRTGTPAGGFALLIPRISPAYALALGAKCVDSCIEEQRICDAIASCRPRVSSICVIYMPDKHSQFDARFALAR